MTPIKVRTPSGEDDPMMKQHAARPAIPIIRRVKASLSPAELAHAADLARRIRQNQPALAATESFGPSVRAGLTDAPGLLVGDQREIALKAEKPGQTLEYRIALLAGDGDLAVVERSRSEFDRYLESILGIADFGTLEIGPPHRPPWPMPARILGRPDLLDRIAQRGRKAGALQIIPHIGTGWTWVLAADLASRAGVPVSVAAPPPRLSRRVNDKLWFTTHVRALLGESAVPPTFMAFGPAAVAGHLRRLSRAAEKVIVKVPDSAGGEGNIAMASAELRRLDLAAIRDRVIGILRARGWTDTYPLLVGIWDSGVTTSPSVQMWIPKREHGLPVIEGLFEQRLAGENGDFIGATPARIPQVVAARLASEAMQIAVLFQHLGYFGRCSVDALVLTERRGAPRIHWIECNGRWGGVSVPMTLANRLLPDHAAPGIAILQDMSATLAARGIGPCLRRLGSCLWRSEANEGVVPLSATALERGIGLHIVVLAENQVRADALALDAVSRLTPRLNAA